MFSIPSITKLLLLAGIILAVWYVFKIVGQIDRERKRLAAQQRQRGPVRPRRAAGRAAEADADAVEDMVKCRRCGAYVPARGTTSCGQPGCPY